MGITLNPLSGKFDNTGPKGATPNASYVTLSTDSTLPNERVLTGTANQVNVTDNGAGSTVVLSTPQNIHTAATPTFSNLTLSARTINRVPYFTTGGAFTDSSTFTYNGTQLGLTTTGSTGGISIGGDVQIYRGAANRLDVASGDSLYVINGNSGLGVGTAPSTNFTASILRTEAASTSTNIYATHTQLVLNGGVNAGSFPGAMRFRTDVSSGANAVNYASAAQALLQVTNSHSGIANNITGMDFSVRWNTNQATAASNILTGLAAFVTADSSANQGALAVVRGAQFFAGLPIGSSSTVSNRVTGIELGLNIPATMLTGAAYAAEIYLGAPTVAGGGSAAPGGLSQIRLADLNVTLTSGTKYPVLFEGTSNDLNRSGIWFGTDANNVGIGRVGNNTFGLASGDSFQLTAGNIITDTTTGTKIGTATTQKLGFWNATPIVQPTTAVAAATFVANTSGILDDSATFDGYTIGQIVKALRNIGALA